MKTNNHPFYLASSSPWPLTGSIGAMTLKMGMIMWFHMNSMMLYFMGITNITMTMIQWWRDMVRGCHTLAVNQGLKLGMILFIISEILLFTAFFWSFFRSSLYPTMEISMMWPPTGIKTFDPLSIPLLNTMILLSSGILVTWSHHSILNNNHNNSWKGLTITVMLGLYFTMLQGWEYMESTFCINKNSMMCKTPPLYQNLW